MSVSRSTMMRSAILVALVPVVSATCTSSSEPCQEGSGTCFDAVQLALSGNVLDAIDTLKYGKYCGAKNFCKVVKKKSATSENKCRNPNRALFLHEIAVEEEQNARTSSRPPCPAVPCDKIDASCQSHDACLDNEVRVNQLPAGERLGVPARCHCDVDLVAQLALQAVLTAPTGLCDEAFYTTSISSAYPVTALSLLKHEAVLLAAPLCCVVYTDECAKDALPGGGTDTFNYGAAYAFCTGVFFQLEGQGISDICSSLA